MSMPDYCAGTGCCGGEICAGCVQKKKHIYLCNGTGCPKGTSCPQCEHPLQPICKENAECALKGCLACKTGIQARCGMKGCPCPECYGIETTTCCCSYMMILTLG